MSSAHGISGSLHVCESAELVEQRRLLCVELGAECLQLHTLQLLALSLTAELLETRADLNQTVRNIDLLILSHWQRTCMTRAAEETRAGRRRLAAESKLPTHTQSMRKD